MEPCYYCGLPSDGMDHALPQSLEATIRNYGWPEFAKLVTFIMYAVPACQECNSALGKKIFATLEERRNYIKQRLKRKHKRLLGSPDWEQLEIDKLGAGLRQFVDNRQRYKLLVKERLSWREPLKRKEKIVQTVVRYSKPNESGNCIAPIIVESKSGTRRTRGLRKRKLRGIWLDL